DCTLFLALNRQYGCATVGLLIPVGGLLDADFERPTPDQPRRIPQAGSGAHPIRTTSRYTHPKTLSQRRRKAGRSPAEKVETAPEGSDGIHRAPVPARVRRQRSVILLAKLPAALPSREQTISRRAQSSAFF